MLIPGEESENSISNMKKLKYKAVSKAVQTEGSDFEPDVD